MLFAWGQTCFFVLCLIYQFLKNNLSAGFREVRLCYSTTFFKKPFFNEIDTPSKRILNALTILHKFLWKSSR